MQRRYRELLSSCLVLFGIGVLWWSQHPDPSYFQQSFTARIYEQYVTGSFSINLAHSSPGTAPFLILVNQLTGVSMFEVMYFPVGAVGRGLLYVAILYVLIDSYWYATVFGIAMALYPWAGYSTSSVHIHALGTVLFLTTVLIVAAVYVRKAKHVARGESLLFATLTCALLFIDYRMVIWVMILFLLLGLSSVVSGANLSPSPLALLIGAAYWLKVTPYQYVGFLTARLSNPLAPVLNYFTAPETSQAFEYQEVSDPLSASRLFFYVLFIAIGLYGLWKAFLIVSESGLPFDLTDEVLIVLGLVGGISTVFYLLIGRFSQSFFIIGVPIIGAVALYKLADQTGELARVVRVCGSGFLLLLVVSGFTIGATTGTLEATSNSHTASAATHLLTTTTNPSVLADLNTVGRFEQQDALLGENATYEFYDVRSYGRVVRGDPVATDYVAVDYGTTNGVRSLGWEKFQNLNRYRSNIHSNTNLDQVYMSENVSIYSSLS